MQLWYKLSFLSFIEQINLFLNHISGHKKTTGNSDGVVNDIENISVLIPIF